MKNGIDAEFQKIRFYWKDKNCTYDPINERCLTCHDRKLCEIMKEEQGKRDVYD